MMLVAYLQPRNLPELLRDWRADTLEFLRVSAPKIAVHLIIAVILIYLVKLVTSRLTKFTQRDVVSTGRAQQLRTAAGVINSVAIFVVVFLTLLQILATVHINMAPLLASAGVAGLAIGFGAQTLVKDVINGFFILLENQYAIGDVVRVAGVHGKVEEMTMRRTILRDDDGTMHVIPNSQITIVSNLTRDWAQVALHISVAYNEDSDRVVKLLQEIGAELRADPNLRNAIVADPQVPGIERVSNGEVDYLMLVKTVPGEQYAVSRELRRRIKESFQKNKIQAGNPARVYVLQGPPGQTTPQ